ncbi:MAG: MFS transporter [Lactobacillales bacterium]|jgi:MFS family permease|nr:MFS transporter [Lactobacillales bacterium]
MVKKPLRIFNWAAFLQTQIFMLPVLLLFYQENGLTVGDYFLFQGIFSLTALLFEIPCGYLGDSFSRRNILILSYSLFILRLLLWMHFGGYWIILAGEVLYSLSKACWSGVADGYIYDYLKTQGKPEKMLKSYGKLNCFMSVGTAIASLAGAGMYGYLKQYFGAHTGFIIVMTIELIVNTASVALLFLLPNVPPAKKQRLTMRDKYRDLFRITRQALTDSRINWYMLFSGLAAGTTMIFVWGFQPLMKISMLPVYLFGVVYFINHMARAASGIWLPKIIHFFTLKKLAVLVYVLFILSFIVALNIMDAHPVYITLALFTFICIAIAFQLSFTMANISRLHALVSSDIRSTVSSVNNMISRTIAGVLLISFKFFLDDKSGARFSLNEVYTIYLVLFLLVLFPLIKVLKTPDPAPYTPPK